MQVLRLDEVLTRVVAWHNRHPLARRIQASQVHSIGEVLLPFASAQPLVAAPATATAPRAVVAPRPGETLADVVSARAAARPAAAPATDALPGLEVHSVLPDEPTDPAGAADPDFDLLPRQPGPGSAPEPPSEPGVGVDVGTGNGIEDTDGGGGAPANPIVDAQSEPDAAAVASEAALDAALDSAAEAMAAAAADADAESAAAPAATSAALGEDSPGVGLAGRLHEPPGFSAATADDAVFAPGPLAEPARRDIDLSSSPTPALAPAPAPAPAAAPPPGAETPPLDWAAAAPVGWLRNIWSRLTGRRPGWPRLEAAFSRDFIWPLTPQAVARWAQRHGQAQSLAPADWPRRQVAPDPARLGSLRQAGLAHTVQLRVLTAAIGVGDRRIRVLMDGEGHIIGPRAYSRPRSAGAAGLMLAVLLSAGAGWPWSGLHPSGDGHGDGAAQGASGATAASAASAVSAALTASATSAISATSATSATAAVAMAASAAGTPAAADPVEAALAASVAAAAHATSAADRAAGPAIAARPAPAEAAARASPAHAGAAAAAPAAAPATTLATAPSQASPSPPPAGPAIEFASPANAAADTPRLGRIRPSLSDEERQVARGQAARLRETPGQGPGQAPAVPRNTPATTATTKTVKTRATATEVSAKPAAPPAPVYAVVTRPSRQRETAASGLVVMRSAAARLSPPAPDHSELMQQQGEWRAAWWPFVRQVDAERARVMLAARGLKTEVVEF